MTYRPLVAISIGDPAGVGPEIVVKALDQPEVYQTVRPLVIGDRWILEQAATWSSVSLEIAAVRSPGEGQYEFGRIDLLDSSSLAPGSLQVGRVQASAGRAAYDYFQRAVELAIAGAVDGVATAPINKEALRAAGVPYLDHTEALAALTQSPNPLTMFVVRDLRIFFLTRHVSLSQVCGQITRSRVHEGLLQVKAALRRFGISEPRIAVAALNPHGGEAGLFGNEEVDEIEPGIHDAQEQGVKASGPIPADAVFHLALIGQYDAVLSLYHDQGHIAAKTLDFERTVSITAGLPFVRSSVDHGTAFNIAGRGIASQVSMVEAIKSAGAYAILLAQTTGRKPAG
jgi:4-hydroxythreonine-4-phosphate dehydrogenase